MTVRFSSKAEKRLREIVERYPRKEAALLPVLWLAQEEFGHLSEEVRTLVASELGLSRAKVDGVVSFYTMYRTEPGAPHRVQICRNLSCRLKGSEELVAWMERETASGGAVECETVECLAACGGAPVVRVDDDYYETAGVQDLERVVGKLRGEDGTDR